MCSLDHSSVIVLCAISVQCQWIHVTSTLCAPPPPQHSHMNQEHVSGGWKMSFLWHRLKGGSISDARFAFSLMWCILERWNVGIRLLQPSSRPLWWACSCYKLEGVRHVCTEARYIINAMHGTSKIKDSCAKKKREREIKSDWALIRGVFVHVCERERLCFCVGVQWLGWGVCVWGWWGTTQKIVRCVCVNFSIIFLPHYANTAPSDYW